MKKQLLVFTLTMCMFTLDGLAQKTGVITINTIYTGILDGYDHICKTMVFIDGELVGETSGQVQSKPNSCSLKAERGIHDIRIVNMANYEGKWEEHTIANEYSIDAFYEGEIKLKKAMTINLVFDITEEKTFAKLK